MNTDSSNYPGQRGELAVRIFPYKTRAICDDYTLKMPWPAACAEVLQEVPAGNHNDQFLGQGVTPTMTTYNRLPKIYLKGTSRISFPGNSFLDASLVPRCAS